MEPPMNMSDAQDHLAMVNRIVAATDRRVRVPPAILVIVGIICTTLTGIQQARQLGWSVPDDQYLHLPMIGLILAAVAVSGWRGRGAPRGTLVDAYAAMAFLMALVVALTLNVTAQNRMVSAAGMGLVWSAAFTMALLMVGAMGSVELLLGGVAMLLATGAASLVPDWFAGVLALGWFCGFVVPGLVLAFRKDDGRTAAL
jgi:hypothetical protein